MKSAEHISKSEMDEDDALQSEISQFDSPFKIRELSVLSLIIFATLMSGLGVSVLLGALI